MTSRLLTAARRALRAPAAAACLLALLAGACGPVAVDVDTDGAPDGGSPEPGAAEAAGGGADGGREPLPDTFEAARDHAFALAAQGAEPELILEALMHAHGLRPEAYGVNVRLGQVAQALGRREEATAAFTRALAARPEDAGAREALAQLHVEAGDAAAAAPLVEAMPPGEARGALLGELGRLRLRDGDFDGARAFFLRGVDEAPGDTGVLKGLADASYRAGDETAGAHWQEVLTLVLALRDNVFTSTRATEAEARDQREAAKRSDYLKRELEGHRARLERLVEVHPAWGQAFLELAELQLEAGEGDAACATMRDWATRHGPGSQLPEALHVDAAEVERQLARFCR